MASNLRKEIFLIGHFKHQITGSKLPSKGDCLRVLFYNMRALKMTLDDSAALVVEECIVFWKKAKIPVQELHKCRSKLKILYDSWKILVKDKNKSSKIIETKRMEFRNNLDDLFDVAHQNALQTMNIEEDKQFLIKQREKGWPGSMIGVDRKRTSIEKRRLQRIEKEKARKVENLEEPSVSTGVCKYNYY